MEAWDSRWRLMKHTKEEFQIHWGSNLPSAWGGWSSGRKYFPQDSLKVQATHHTQGTVCRAESRQILNFAHPRVPSRVTWDVNLVLDKFLQVGFILKAQQWNNREIHIWLKSHRPWSVILALWAKGLGSASCLSLSLVCEIFRLILTQSSSSNL